MPGSRPLSIAVVGARRVRQGTGEWVAKEFARRGHEVSVVVGTTPATADNARVALERHGIFARSCTSLDSLLGVVPIDAVAICSPAEHHAADVARALSGGCHVFCEKPFFWPFDRKVLTRLLELAEQSGRYLGLNLQWPHTLSSFYELHPGIRGEPVTEVAMWLGPTTTGAPAVVDSAPHLLSLLEALVGGGTIEAIQTHVSGDRTDVAFVYRHAGGSTVASLQLVRTPEQPRPAGYRINGRSVERRIRLPDYSLSFESAGRSIPIPDPLGLSVEAFVRSVREERRADSASLERSLLNLAELVAAMPAGGAS